MSALFPGDSLDSAVCSRSGCVEVAVWRIDWSNPRIHTDGRTKTWLACGEHRDVLSGFLSSRGFPLEVSAFEAGAA